ncbi:MAG: bifunctional [glutamate--ammonia ligase]-adenylyl-L-tyrosine phosphorylase/[glutamate--ammonia-ligase] adenylyltransferase [Desulfobacteraceae bacterium]|nr:bifunctional [glutamate--ammonia ligase]-adenylyl-L-tyrosine phosphorylase/[glutamate--ammonia-ligase] adenylyltransferase [Desulfobacteraceae bacterium]
MQDQFTYLEHEREKSWRDYGVSAREKGVRPAEGSFAELLKAVFPLSEFITKICIRRPDLPEDLHGSGELYRTRAAGEAERIVAAALGRLQENFEETALQAALRQIRNREMFRIAFRDLSGMADLAETLSDLTCLAEACIDQTLNHLYHRLCNRFGIPTGNTGEKQHLCVVGLGKLGAGELNFSSDVDLVFAYPHSGNTAGTARTISNEVFFFKLCQRLISALSATTVDGFVFRVDTRLRPFGDGGPLAMSFDAMEDYYQHQGREWERYALIKARIVAGDKRSGNLLINRLKPFVYRRYLDFGAFESLRQMKEKIAREIVRKKLWDNIKLGPGGIREVEFFGQMFQLIRGGVSDELQAPGIQTILDILARKNIVPVDTIDRLMAAYTFLRRTENRLQEFADKQTHHLPTDDIGRHRLAVSMDFSGWSDFAAALNVHRANVHRQFNLLLTSSESNAVSEKQSPEISALESVWQNTGDDGQYRDILITHGFDNTDTALKLLADLREDPGTRAMSEGGKARLNLLMPRIIQAVASCRNPIDTLGRIIDLVKSIGRRTSYLALLVEYPNSLIHLVKLADASPWIITFLSNHPVLLDELLDARSLYIPPQRHVLDMEMAHRINTIDSDDFEYQMEALRVFKQVNTLRVAASDITGVLPLMQVSDHLSDIAETIVNTVVDLSWRHLVERHGKPACSLNQVGFEKGFAVVAYGKLGGLELGYGSDLDLVFIHAAAPGQTSGPKRPIDNTYFFARLGQRVIHTLTAYTPAGRLYEVDVRLRPSGESGILVGHINGFRDYQLGEAWAWEHQALIRARVIAGDHHIRRNFEQVRREVLAQPRSPHKLKKKVVRMREKLRQAQQVHQKGSFDLKHGVGGIVDIEFIVQYLVLVSAHKYPDILRWTDNVRLLQSLAANHIIDGYTAHFLRHAYLIYRAVVHRRNLQEATTMVDTERFRELQKGVERVWKSCFGS